MSAHVHDLDAVTGSDLTKRSSKEGTPTPSQSPYLACAEDVDDENPGRGNNEPEGYDCYEEHHVEREVASPRGRDVFCKIGHRFVDHVGVVRGP